MDYSRPSQIDEPAYRGVLETYRCDEATQINRLLEIARLSTHTSRRVEAEAGAGAGEIFKIFFYKI